MDENEKAETLLAIRFPVGVIVAPSDKAIKDGRWHRERRWRRLVLARVIGYAGDCLRVQVMNRKHPSIWHHSLWVISDFQMHEKEHK